MMDAVEKPAINPAPATQQMMQPLQKSAAEIAKEEAAQKAIQIQSEFSGKISAMLTPLTQGGQVDAYFFDPKTEKILLTRDYIEMILQEFGQASQNMSYLQKFVQIDSKLDKALREYRVDIQSLLSSIMMAPPSTA